MKEKHVRNAWETAVSAEQQTTETEPERARERERTVSHFQLQLHLLNEEKLLIKRNIFCPFSTRVIIFMNSWVISGILNEQTLLVGWVRLWAACLSPLTHTHSLAVSRQKQTLARQSLSSKHVSVMNLASCGHTAWVSHSTRLPTPDVKCSPEGVTLHSKGLMCRYSSSLWRPAVWLRPPQGSPLRCLCLWYDSKTGQSAGRQLLKKGNERALCRQWKSMRDKREEKDWLSPLKASSD